MFALWRRPPFDSDALSSIWVMACRDESPVVTAFSIAFRLGRGITPDQVMELVKGRRELFRLGLTPAQSRAWKERYRRFLDGSGRDPNPEPRPKKPDQDKEQHKGKEGQDKKEDGKEKKDGQDKGQDEGAKEPRPYALPDWLRTFDDEGPQPDQDRVREWLSDKGITSSKQALERFLDKGFVIDECVIRSVFRLEPGLDAPPSDLATVNWGLEHIDRLRRGRAETRQSLVALTTGIGGVAIGAGVALLAPVVTTIYQGRPLDNARLTFDHQTLVTGYSALAGAAATARSAARAGDGKALGPALAEIDKQAASILPLVPDKGARDGLRERRARVAEACAPAGPPGQDPPPAPTCPAAVEDLQRLLDGPLADVVAR
jgi:hypothetical protein